MSKYSPIGSEFKTLWFFRIRSRIGHLLAIAPGEGRVLFWSFTYFFSLLCSYYIVRPMRDEMGIANGVEKLQWMLQTTFAPGLHEEDESGRNQVH